MGKGTLVQQLLAKVPNLWLSRSWTTRARRKGEPEDAYYFVDRDAFERHVADGGFLEWVEFLPGQLSGTPMPAPPEGDDVVLEIDVRGGQQVKAARPDAVQILVVAPSREVQERRLRARGDDEPKIEARLAMADHEEGVGRAFADHVVVNDDLARAVDEVAGIVELHRSQRTRPGDA